MTCELDFFSYQTNPVDFEVPSHTHNCYELVYYVTGRGTTTLDQKQHVYHNNSFSIITPKTLHNEFATAETQMIYFGFKYDDMPIHLTNGIYQDVPGNQTILQLLKEMKAEVLAPKPHFNLVLNLLIGRILIEYDRLYSNKKVEKENSFAYIINFINENYNQQIDPRSLADMVCLSYDRFRHLFKEVTGFSPFGYIIQTRLKHAKDMLQYSNRTITEIAFTCGFPSASQFSNIFKERYRVAPNDYRSSKLKQKETSDTEMPDVSD